MNDTVLIQYVYPGTNGERYLDLTRKHNAAYCAHYDYDFWCLCEKVTDISYEQGNWAKIALILKAMSAGYRYIIWLDADAIIKDVDTDLRDAVQNEKIGACWHRIPQLDHWNVGALYIHNSQLTRSFVANWLAGYPAPADGWMEQGVFNRMGRKDKTVVTLSDKWNATIDVSMVPDAVVIGFHGQGDADFRYNLMREAFIRLFPEQEATLPAQGEREVLTNG